MLIQLHPPIPILAKGHKGLAHALIDYGPEYDLLWVTFLDNGECWAVPNPEIRGQTNWTFGRDTAPKRIDRIEDFMAANIGDAWRDETGRVWLLHSLSAPQPDLARYQPIIDQLNAQSSR